MGTLSLSCPFCCNETFTSYKSLKYHILSLVDNLLCPACNSRFDEIHELADHLGRECGPAQSEDVSPVVEQEQPTTENLTKHSKMDDETIKIETDPTVSHAIEDAETVDDNEGFKENSEVILKTEQDLDDILTVNTIINLGKAQLASSGEDAQEEQQPTEESTGLYLCQMCNVNFNSIEEHLGKYHEGEEVLLETEGDNGLSQEQDQDQDETVFDESNLIFDDSETEIIEEESEEGDLSKKLNTIEEQECVDKEGRLYTRKVVKIDKFWMKNSDFGTEIVKPLLEKYLLLDGKIKKITQEEAENLEDKSGIIEIHQCPKCCLQFPNLTHYTKHKCDASNAKHKYKCAYCTALFLNLKSLQTHMNSHVKEDPTGNTKRTVTLGPYLCDICQTKFPSFKSLRLHSRMHEPVQQKHAEAPVSYSICGPEEKKVRQMFICTICNKTYDMAYKDVHLKSHSDEDHHNCTVCNRKFFTQENLEMHMKAHSNVKKFICSYCKKPFLTYDAFSEHTNNNQCQKRPYECQFCGRRFSRPHEKVKHERIHTGEKPHICEICGKAFRVSYCLTLHMRTHSGTRPYQCTHCGKRFKSHSVFNHHLQTHSDVRAYKCPFCPKAFKTRVQLAGHKNSHIKPFSCVECNRPFASLYAVRAHMETHKRDNNLKYDCWLCGASYARAFALRDHMKAQHEDTILGGLENETVNDSEVAESTGNIVQELVTAMEIEEEGG